MKFLKNIAVLFAFLTLTTSAFANSHLFTLKSVKATKITAEPVLVTITVIANPPFSATYTGEDFVGTSTTEPCSDLHSIGVSEPEQYTFISGIGTLTSADFINGYDKALTCVKSNVTFTKSGNTYSTGNVQLLWNEATQAYDSAMPDNVTVNISNQ